MLASSPIVAQQQRAALGREARPAHNIASHKHATGGDDGRNNLRHLQHSSAACRAIMLATPDGASASIVATNRDWYIILRLDSLSTGCNSSLRLIFLSLYFLRLDMQNTVACDWVHCSLRLLPAGYYHRKENLLNLSTKAKRYRIYLSKRHRFAIANFKYQLWLHCSSLLIADVTADFIIADPALALLDNC
ncbi:hypothetical protein F511_28893 [Dorcoceras hygrometricum]|uniref:Uncharacterized protein n=1 Tax=Dorcoceras hygrometricum TaxID=472368 RepID=A0A2Z7CMD8_9LAMI|nr:hypothetical protein F511_28893 [Dorcoceras hygrometricum]